MATTTNDDLSGDGAIDVWLKELEYLASPQAQRKYTGRRVV
jgi:hypothetical protein